MRNRLRFDDIAYRERYEYLVSSGGETDASDELEVVRKRSLKKLEKKRQRAEEIAKKPIFGTKEEQLIINLRVDEMKKKASQLELEDILKV